MEWRNIGTYNITETWQLSPILTAKTFRITHLLLGISSFRPTAIVSLCGAAKNEDGATVTYQPQALKYYLESEIIQFNNIPKNWAYKLGFKQVILSTKASIVDWRIKVDMPVVDLNPDQPIVNPTIATTKNPTPVPVGPAANTAVKLLPVNTTNSRKHATFFNPSTTRNLYIDTDSNINIASAIAKVAPGKVYVSDIPGWQGEYWGMLDGAGTTATNIAVEEYV